MPLRSIPGAAVSFLILLAINIGSALVLFALRAGTVTEGERFAVTSREAALVFNNVMLSSILGIVLIGTLYPLLTEAFGEKVSVGPPYFNPMAALFAVPMLLVVAVGPLLRWRRDEFTRVRPLLMPGLAVLLVAAAVVLWLGVKGLPYIGLALAPAIAVASLMPLRGRNLRRLPLPVWGMVIAHLGLSVTLFGMACDSAFSTEKLLAAHLGQSTQVGPWQVTLTGVEPVAGQNWTALEAELQARYGDGEAFIMTPQARSFWAPVQNTTVSALHTRWNGQLYTVLGEEAAGGRWQLRLWWKPFVPCIWLGGALIGLGGFLALLGRVIADLKRIAVRDKMADRRLRQGR